MAALTDAAHGFVAADLAALCNEAAMIALRRLVAHRQPSDNGGNSPGGTPCVALADFQAAEARVRPSAMRELAFEVPKVSGVAVLWGSGGGLEGGGRGLATQVLSAKAANNPMALAAAPCLACMHPVACTISQLPLYMPHGGAD